MSPWLKYHPDCHSCNFPDDNGLKCSSNLWILCLSNLSLFWRCFVCIVCPLSFMSDKRRGQPLSVNVQMSTPGQTVCSMLSQHFSLERAVCQPCQVLKSCLNYIYSTYKIKGFLWIFTCSCQTVSQYPLEWRLIQSRARNFLLIDLNNPVQTVWTFYIRVHPALWWTEVGMGRWNSVCGSRAPRLKSWNGQTWD